ncbi:DUF3418 domain-containing protein [Actinomyces polynesiensis]|uniref:DUF3418 domain-containing protein n=1 Tax=Actinomyces polynesiensis TaxID=1325934 RepID=UPI0009E51578|nr:DUF3418 domain-containing protein [Actinomyces polynesiensis]
MIGHTQPRRIAARAVADRIAEELGQKVGRAPGEVIGYQVRFTDEVGPTTLVKLMTDGILLAEIQSDPLLRRYDTLIIDEAHERSLNIDFILGYIARLLPLRPDLKVVITSATIDSTRFAAHFGRWEGRRGRSRLVAPAPVIEVSGRTYPVEIRYRPLSADLPRNWSSSTPPSAKSAQFPPRSPSSPAARPASTGRGTDGVPTGSRPDTADAEWSGTNGDIASDETGTPHPGVQQLVLEDPDDDLPTLGYGLGEDIDQEQAICDAVDELCAEGPGDILVFLPGERDIRDTQQALADHLGPRALIDPKAPHRPDAIEIVPLFARLTAAEQHRVFEPHSLRRVVLATNVAETSLTVPGVRYVIDPGLARISRYSNRTKVQRLPIEPISQASANQRAGRSGRVADGVAIRLYSQRDYESRPEFTEPEILRTSLASVILQMAALGLGAVSDFPFLDPPEPRAVRDGIQLLVEIGALEPDDAAAPPSSVGTGTATAGHDRRGGRDTGARGRTSSPEQSGLRRSGGHRLTAVGRDLATLPIDPRLGRMLIEGDANGCASEVLVIVAALSIQDVRERPLDHQQAADASHARFTDPTSDFITYLNLWRYLNVQSRDLSGSAFRRMCRGEFLHYLRFREWRDVVNQLRQMARPLDLDIHPIGEPTPAQVAHAAASGGIADAAARAVVAYTASSGTVDADEVHRALLVGLLSNLGNWDEAKRDYAGARGTHFTIWPGSGLARSHPAWVMTAELVETSRLFARTVARIRPEWIEPLAGPLLRRVYSEPYWSTSRGAAMVKEKVLLYGMTLVADRPVLLGRLDVTFGGGQRRSSVARPGTLAGVAQGLRARGRGEREVGESTALADALSEALVAFGVEGTVGSGSGAHEGGPAAASGTTSGSPEGGSGTTSGSPEGGSGTTSGSPEGGSGTTSGPAAASGATSDAEPPAGATDPGPVTPAGPDAGEGPEADTGPEVDAESAEDSGITARELAREMFIRHALVLGEWREHHRFMDRNQELLEDAREAERRSRTHGLVADEEARFAFFDDLIPADIVSARHFDQWWKHQRRETPDLLTYTPRMLLPRGAGTDPRDFPDHWQQGDLRLPLTYRFTPGSTRDGVTMTIPVEVLPRVGEQGTDWLVPGMLEDLCTEMVRALPKAKRRLLAPAPEVGTKVAQWLTRALAGETPTGPAAGDAGATPSGQGGSRSGTESRPDTRRGGDGSGTTPDPRSLDAALGRLAAWTRASGQRNTPARGAVSGAGSDAGFPSAGSSSPGTGTTTPAASPASAPTAAPAPTGGIRVLRGVHARGDTGRDLRGGLRPVRGVVEAPPPTLHPGLRPRRLRGARSEPVPRGPRPRRGRTA